MIGKRLDELERVIELYQDALFRFAFFRTGSLADSQDIVQNVFLKMVDSSRDLAHVGDLKNYLFRCVSNACCDWTEKRRHTGTLSLERVGVAAETDTEEEWMHEYVRIGSMLEGLPARQAEVVRMRCVDGLRFAEIADMLGVSLPTVKSRFRYGIEKMRTIEKKGKL